MNTLRYITEKYGLKDITKSPIDVAKMSRAELAKVFAKLGFVKGAQVGMWNDNYFKVLCDFNPKLQLYGIDIANKIAKKDVPNNCKMVRMSSLDAAKKFVDASLDFVYIDSNQDFVSSTNDIDAWSKKVRPGGIVAGHDFFAYRAKTNLHTREALMAYVSAYHVTPWFVIGREIDQVRSWFWVKV